MAQIKLQNIAHSYNPNSVDSKYALKPFDMTWVDGGRYAILGPSGCGKSTMLNIMSGIVNPLKVDYFLMVSTLQKKQLQIEILLKFFSFQSFMEQ